MDKFKKTAILLMAIAIVLVIVIVLSSKIITINPSKYQPAVKTQKAGNTLKDDIIVDFEKFEKNYKNSIKIAVSKIDELISILPETYSAEQATTTIIAGNKQEVLDEISQIKIGLMDLKVPEDYKPLHFELVQILTKIKEYVDDEKSVDLPAKSVILLEDIKAKYSWLND